jgi:hypothetical protein
MRITLIAGILGFVSRELACIWDIPAWPADEASKYLNPEYALLDTIVRLSSIRYISGLDISRTMAIIWDQTRTPLMY